MESIKRRAKLIEKYGGIAGVLPESTPGTSLAPPALKTQTSDAAAALAAAANANTAVSLLASRTTALPKLTRFATYNSEVAMSDQLARMAAAHKIRLQHLEQQQAQLKQQLHEMQQHHHASPPALARRSSNLHAPHPSRLHSNTLSPPHATLSRALSHHSPSHSSTSSHQSDTSHSSHPPTSRASHDAGSTAVAQSLNAQAQPPAPAQPSPPKRKERQPVARGTRARWDRLTSVMIHRFQYGARFLRNLIDHAPSSTHSQPAPSTLFNFTKTTSEQVMSNMLARLVARQPGPFAVHTVKEREQKRAAELARQQEEKRRRRARERKLAQEQQRSHVSRLHPGAVASPRSPRAATRAQQNTSHPSPGSARVGDAAHSDDATQQAQVRRPPQQPPGRPSPPQQSSDASRARHRDAMAAQDTQRRLNEAVAADHAQGQQQGAPRPQLQPMPQLSPASGHLSHPPRRGGPRPLPTEVVSLEQQPFSLSGPRSVPRRRGPYPQRNGNMTDPSDYSADDDSYQEAGADDGIERSRTPSPHSDTAAVKQRYRRAPLPRRAGADEPLVRETDGQWRSTNGASEDGLNVLAQGAASGNSVDQLGADAHERVNEEYGYLREMRHKNYDSASGRAFFVHGPHYRRGAHGEPIVMEDPLHPANQQRSSTPMRVASLLAEDQLDPRKRRRGSERQNDPLLHPEAFTSAAALNAPLAAVGQRSGNSLALVGVSPLKHRATHGLGGIPHYQQPQRRAVRVELDSARYFAGSPDGSPRFKPHAGHYAHQAAELEHRDGIEAWDHTAAHAPHALHASPSMTSAGSLSPSSSAALSTYTAGRQQSEPFMHPDAHMSAVPHHSTSKYHSPTHIVQRLLPTMRGEIPTSKNERYEAVRRKKAEQEEADRAARARKLEQRTERLKMKEQRRLEHRIRKLEQRRLRRLRKQQQVAAQQQLVQSSAQADAEPHVVPPGIVPPLNLASVLLGTHGGSPRGFPSMSPKHLAISASDTGSAGSPALGPVTASRLPLSPRRATAAEFAVVGTAGSPAVQPATAAEPAVVLLAEDDEAPVDLPPSAAAAAAVSSPGLAPTAPTGPLASPGMPSAVSERIAARRLRRMSHRTPTSADVPASPKMSPLTHAAVKPVLVALPFVSPASPADASISAAPGAKQSPPQAGAASSSGPSPPQPSGSMSERVRQTRQRRLTARRSLNSDTASNREPLALPALQHSSMPATTQVSSPAQPSTISTGLRLPMLLPNSNNSSQ